ncbi:hypothetical protein V8E55_007513 [Tylopilus felleus]
MSSSDSLVGFCSMEESFVHLRALLSYASNNAGNESSIYGTVSFILTLFCASARVTATKFKNLSLGSFPQKDLKQSTSNKKFRAPEFTVLVVQSAFGSLSAAQKIKDMGPLIWEVKTGSTLAERFPWFGEGSRMQPDHLEQFSKHFKQVAAQVVYAKAKFNRKPIYALISIDIWFILLHFPGDPPTVSRNSEEDDSAVHRMFEESIVVPPARIVNEECTAFSPEFLYALHLSVKDLTGVTVIPHPSFHAPEGIAERVSEQLKNQWVFEKLEGRRRHAEIDNKFALGEEDSDERSERWSTTEDTKTEQKDPKYRAGAPKKIDRSSSPPRTRSQTTVERLKAAAKASTGPETSNRYLTLDKAANRAGPSRTEEVPVINPALARKSKRDRRKAVQTTPANKKDN